MKIRLLMSAMLTAAFCSTPTWAAWSGFAQTQGAVPAKAPKSKPYSITLTISGGYGGSGTTTTTGCPGGGGYANHCLSGNCECYTYTGSVIGAAGTGTMTFYESEDFTISNNGIDDHSGCDLAFGDIEITGSKDTETISFIGSDCGSAWASKGFLTGGCVLENTNVFSMGAVGSCSGKYNYVSGKNTTFTITGTSLK